MEMISHIIRNDYVIILYDNCNLASFVNYKSNPQKYSPISKYLRSHEGQLVNDTAKQPRRPTYCVYRDCEREVKRYVPSVESSGCITNFLSFAL